MDNSDPPQRPKIACLPNGPYYLLNDPFPRTIPNLQRSNGKSCATVTGVALCRCGGSRNKPFCDGTHGSIGFSDQRLTDAGAGKRASYAGRQITIHDNRAICAHAGYCTDRLKSVFRMNQEPWIDADGATTAEIVDTIRLCPSGALSYTLGGAEHRDQERAPMVTVTKDGPYAVTGGIELLGVEFAPDASREHYTLCRCGASKNKPFCDGSHWAVGFRDEQDQ
ncbi:MAG TPA: CDGSH iron-sulfur domain-containing protein [Burkholderiales bacterium]